MKYCHRPFDFVQIDWNGNVHSCAWTTVKLGNLLENTLEEIWNGKEANQLRESIINGTYRYCIKHTCPYCNNNSLQELKDQEYEKAIVNIPYPTQFNLAYDYVCNHKCPSCRPEIFKVDEEYERKMKIIEDRLLPYLNSAELICADGNGDMFASKYMVELFSKLEPENPDIKFFFETNGVFCDEAHWERVKHLEKYNIEMTVTYNSYDRDAYKYLSGGIDSLDKLLNNMKFISGLREANRIKKLSVSIVVQDRNFREVPSYIKRTLEEYAVDEIVLKPIYPWFKLTANDYWFKDVLNPLHPYFDEYQEILKDPIFSHPKVFKWGFDNIHEPKEHPYIKYKSHLDFCLKLLESGMTKQWMGEKISKLGKCAIYGMGTIGKFLYDYVENIEGVQVEYFIDRYTREREYKGKEVRRLFCNDFTGIDTIIVTPVQEFDYIKSTIEGENYNAKIINIYELIGGVK